MRYRKKRRRLTVDNVVFARFTMKFIVIYVIYYLLTISISNSFGHFLPVT
jgi:hypothetical protein